MDTFLCPLHLSPHQLQAQDLSQDHVTGGKGRYEPPDRLREEGRRSRYQVWDVQEALCEAWCDLRLSLSQSLLGHNCSSLSAEVPKLASLG